MTSLLVILFVIFAYREFTLMLDNTKKYTLFRISNKNKIEKEAILRLIRLKEIKDMPKSQQQVQLVDQWDSELNGFVASVYEQPDCLQPQNEQKESTI